MMTREQYQEMRMKVEQATPEATESFLAEAKVFLQELDRVKVLLDSYTNEVNSKLEVIESDMTLLEKENARLRSVTDSTYFERDACVGLISKMARQIGIPVGTLQQSVEVSASDGQASAQLEYRVVMDLPSGQVSWDYLASEAHLFEDLPAYANTLEDQTIQQNYSKILNPNLDF